MAPVTVVIHNRPHPIRLKGITVMESRPGWVALDIPPLEAWKEVLAQLPSPQRKRIESPEFFRILQTEVTRRFQALKKQQK